MLELFRTSARGSRWIEADEQDPLVRTHSVHLQEKNPGGAAYSINFFEGDGNRQTMACCGLPILPVLPIILKKSTLLQLVMSHILFIILLETPFLLEIHQIAIFQ